MKRRDTDGAVDSGSCHRIAAVRQERGLSRSQLARKSGLSRRQIAAFEEATTVPTASELAAVSRACGVSPDEIMRPELDARVVAGVVESGADGELRGQAASDALLREYLSMLLELRRVAALAPISLRQDDLTELAKALGGTPELIEARLIELVETDTQSASELRVTMLSSPAS